MNASGRGLTIEELEQLDAACRSSTRAFDTLLDQLCESTKRGCATKGRRGKPRLVIRHDKLGIHDPNSHQLAPDRLARVLRLAGLAAAVRRRRKEDEKHPPGPQRVPSAVWVSAAERPTTAAPDIQALACLQLLQSDTTVRRSFPWVHELAAPHLARLLADHPVLMHPRLVFDYDSDTGITNQREPLPMMHALVTTPAARLPSPLVSTTPAALKAFALHPAVKAGIRARAPRLDVNHPPPSNVGIWGNTIGANLERSTAARPALLGALLHIDRLYQEASLRGGTPKGSLPKDSMLLDGPGQVIDGAMNLVQCCFDQLWCEGVDSPNGRVRASRQLAAQEIAAAPTLQLRDRVPQLLWNASRIFCEPVTKGSIVSTQPTSNPIERFDRLVQLLQNLRVADSKRQATGFVLRALFPCPGEGTLSTHSSYASLEVAHGCIQRFVDQGFALDVIGERIRRWNTSSSSAWLQAQASFETEKLMSECIERRSAGAKPAHDSISASLAVGTTPSARRRIGI